jgi:hypothetical protein
MFLTQLRIPSNCIIVNFDYSRVIKIWFKSSKNKKLILDTLRDWENVGNVKFVETKYRFGADIS